MPVDPLGKKPSVKADGPDGSKSDAEAQPADVTNDGPKLNSGDPSWWGHSDPTEFHVWNGHSGLGNNSNYFDWKATNAPKSAGESSEPSAPDLSHVESAPDVVPSTGTWATANQQAWMAQYWQKGTEIHKRAENPIRVVNGRVVPKAALKIDLLGKGINKLSDLPRHQMLKLLAAEFSEKIGPIKIASDWSLDGRVPAGTTLKPWEPRTNRAPDACFLPLDPAVAYAHLEIDGTSRSSALLEKMVRDFDTGEERPIRPNDGAFLALFFVRDDGVIIPAHQGRASWTENTKFIDEEEHESIFNLAIVPEQSHGVVGALLVNVSEPSHKDPETNRQLTAVRLTRLHAQPLLSPVMSQAVFFGDDTETRNTFPQLRRLDVHDEKRVDGQEWTFTAKNQTKLFVYHHGQWLDTFDLTRNQNPPEKVTLDAGIGVMAFDVAAGETVKLSGDVLRAVLVNEAYDAKAVATERFGLPEPVAEVFNAAAQRVFGRESAAELRAELESEMKAQLSTVHLVELMRQCRPMSALAGRLLNGEFATKHDCHTLGDVMHVLMTTETGWGSNPKLTLEKSPLADDQARQAFANAINADDPQGAITALGYPPDAHIEELCGQPSFAEAFYNALVDSKSWGNYEPLEKMAQVFNPDLPSDIYTRASHEAQDVASIIRKSNQNFRLQMETPSRYLRTMFPRTTADLDYAGVKYRVGEDGRPLALLSRTTAAENTLFQIPHGRDYMGQLRPQGIPKKTDTYYSSSSPKTGLEWVERLRGHFKGSSVTDVVSPFTSWSYDTRSFGFSGENTNYVFAEVPIEEIVVDLPSQYGESEVLLTAMNPAYIRLVLTQDKYCSLKSPVQGHDFTELATIRELLTKDNLTTSTYWRDDLSVDSKRYEITGKGADAVRDLLDAEIELTDMDKKLEELGLERFDGAWPQSYDSYSLRAKHPALGGLTSNALDGERGPAYGVPFEIKRADFVDENGKIWNLPFALTRKRGIIFLRDREHSFRPDESPSATLDKTVFPGTRIAAAVTQQVAGSFGLTAAKVRVENGNVEVGPVVPPRSRDSNHEAALQFVLDLLLGIKVDPFALAKEGSAAVTAAGFVGENGQLSLKNWPAEVDLETAPASALSSKQLLEALEELEVNGLQAACGEALAEALQVQHKKPDTIDKKRYAMSKRLAARIESLRSQLV